MYPGKLTWFSLLAFILLAGLLAGCDEENQPQNGESGTPPKMLQGEVKSVNPDKRKLILRTSTSEEQGESTDQQGEGTTEQGTQTVPFKLAEDATITVLGEEADLTALKAGQQAEVGYSVREGGTNEAASVEVTNQPPEPKTATGEIKAVKADNRKVKLKPGSTEQGEAEQDTQTQKFKLRKNATVTVLGEEADVAALKAGQQAQIQYFIEEGTNSGHSVKVTKQAPVVETTTGEIKKAKPDRRKVILRVGLETVPFKLVKQATITVNGQNADLAALNEGQQAQIQYIVEEGINRARSVRVGETAAVSGPTPG